MTISSRILEAYEDSETVEELIEAITIILDEEGSA